MRKKTKEKHSILIDGNSNKRIEIKFSDKNAFFTIQFQLINSCFPKVDIYKNDQGIANQKIMEKIKINGTNKSGIDRANKTGIGGTNKLDIGKKQEIQHVGT